MADYRVLVVTFPGQGHINPSLQLAKRLARNGVNVTLLTSLSAIRRMAKSSSKIDNNLIDFVSFSDGYDGGWTNDTKVPEFMSSLKDHGSKAVADIIRAKREEGKPFTRLVYSLLVPWAGQVASSLKTPITLLWIQPATLLGIYFYYFNNYADIIGNNEVIDLPGLPILESKDLPSFLLASTTNIYDFALPLIKENFEVLDGEVSPCVLVNSFDALEPGPLKVIEKYKVMAIGPLIPSAFLDGKDPSDTSFGADLVSKSVDYIGWLDSKEKHSIIYIAFGSYSKIPQLQVEEIAKGVLKSQRPFLWVIRGSEKREDLDQILSCREELEKQGKIVPWCSQVEVLSHPSLGCFVSHCGWNSTLESLACGVPMVGIPQWTDQATNIKLVQDVWRTGVRAMKAENGSGVVESDEIARCLEIVLDGGERSEEMRKQGKRWKDLAKEAMHDDGASNLNLKNFVDLYVVSGHNISGSTD